MPKTLQAIIHFCCLLLVFTSVAQPNSPSLTPELPSVLQPSPNAATLGKFFDQPVSLHTGLPSITIPLWQIKRGDIALDIALSYHGGGLKVDEPASWVGIGWTLQGTGLVTRTARGLPDDIEQFKAFDLPRLNRYFAQAMAADERALFLNQVYRGELDSEPDLYNVSVGGIACQFYMNSIGEFVAMPRELNLRIAYKATDSYGVRYTWLITDSRGVQYKFLDAEHTSTSSYSSVTGGVSSGGLPIAEFEGDTSWALREIEDTKGNRVQFSYESDGSVFSTIASERFSYTNSHNPYCSDKGGSGYTYSLNQGNTQRLIAITCGQEQLRFVANSADRQDARYSHSLDRIEIRYGAHIKRVFRFFSAYWGATTEGTRGVYYPDNQNQSRLRLDSVREESADGRLRKPAFRFTYFEGNLPYRNSAAQDHWGYYNGQDNHSRVSYTMGGHQAGANKAPNPVYALMGTLAAIRYPTGGVTSFTYEPNRYVHDVTTTAFDSVLVTGVLAGDQTGYEFTRNIPFEITPAMVGNKRRVPVILDFTQSVSFNGQPVSTNVNSGFSAGAGVFVTGHPEQGILFPIIPDSGRCAYLPVGHYTLHLAIEKEYLENPYVFLQAKLTAPLTSEAGRVEVYGPGLRIKKVSQRFGFKSTVVHTYDYTNPDTKKSSGQLGSLPSYESTVRYHFMSQVGENAQYRYVCPCKEFTSTSKYPLLTTQGSYIGYSHVTEYLDSAQIAGKTTHTFTNFDYFNDLNARDHQAFPYAPSGSQSWKRGLPLLTKVWLAPASGVSASAKLQVADSLQYDLLPNSTNWTYGLKLGMADRYVESGNGSNGMPWPDFAMGPQQLVDALTLVQYPLESDSYQLSTKTTTQYAATGRHQTASSYAYTPDTYQMRRVTSKNSDGSTTVQRQYYPSDYAASASSSTLLSALVAANRLTVPLEQSQLRLPIASTALNRDGLPRLVTAIAHEYGTVKDPAGWPVFYLQKVQVANTSRADTSQHYQGGSMPSFYEEKARVMQVTKRGNPLTQITQRQKITSYKWDYEERYVQAVCQNARAGEFFYEGFEESGGNETQPGAHSGNHFAMGTYTVNWPRPNSRLYRLSYWCRQGGVWHYQQQPYSGPSVTLTGGDAYDDVRILPLDAQLTTYTYEPLVGETSVISPDGRMTTYEYDGLGRLVRTRDEQGRILSQQQYHYAGK